MFRNVLITICLICCISVTPQATCAGELTESYYLFMSLGKDALREKNYPEALRFFQHAQYLGVNTDTPTQYINYIKHQIDSEPQQETPARYRDDHQTLREEAGITPEPQTSPSTQDVKRSVTAIPVPASTLKKTAAQAEAPPEPRSTRKRVVIDRSPITPNKREPIDLDAAFFARQPRTLIQIELNSSVILEGRNIERVLDITPGFVEVRRLNKDDVQIVALKRGSTLLHLWDDTGRWTFDIEIIIPIDEESRIEERDPIEEYNRKFRISYSADWGSFYTGPSLDEVERSSLNFIQRLEIEGETPYGIADGWMVFNKLDDANELTGYSIGLTDGEIGDFKDFTIRGFDNSKSFSNLSMPGQYLRGVMFDKWNIIDVFDFSYIRGRDRATFGFLAPDVLAERDSYVEGVKVGFKPNDDHYTSIQFARGWGEDRPEFLKDRVYSIRSEQRINNFEIEAEVAHDEDVTSEIVSTSLTGRNYDFSLSVRDIHEDFTTITNLPSNRGEVGGLINYAYHWEHVHLSSTLDLYRDRLFFNEENPDAINIDFSSLMDYRITDKDRFYASVFYVDTPGELSPRRNFRYTHRYTHRFDFWDRHPVTAFVGNTYQRSRLKVSAASEYDRYALSLGFRLPLLRNLDYFWNYEISYVDEKFGDEDTTPSVMNTGMNYSHKFSDTWRGNAAISYRDEQETEGTNSFLAGEDSIIASMGVNYRPHEDFEFFADGRLRNIWKENNDNTPQHEVDVRMGVRTSWDLPLRWNPHGVVYGRVYKDDNGNQKRDPGEKGIPGIRVNVGHNYSVTDEKGDYVAEVFAKRVQVAIDINTLPRGHVFSTSASQGLEIGAHRWHEIDFGLSTQSGIYGLVYADANGNGKPDEGDEFVQRVKFTLDNNDMTLSDYDGSYFFRNVEPGEHTITLDVNSIPMEYLPKVKVRQTIEVPEGGTYTLHIPLQRKK